MIINTVRGARGSEKEIKESWMKYQPILVIHITKRKATMRVQYFDLASVYDITSSIFIMNMKMKISINVQCTMYKSPPDTSLELFVWCRRSACRKASRGCSRLISTLPLLPIPTSNSHFSPHSKFHHHGEQQQNPPFKTITFSIGYSSRWSWITTLYILHFEAIESERDSLQSAHRHWRPAIVLNSCKDSLNLPYQAIDMRRQPREPSTPSGKSYDGTLILTSEATRSSMNLLTHPFIFRNRPLRSQCQVNKPKFNLGPISGWWS